MSNAQIEQPYFSFIIFSSLLEFPIYLFRIWKKRRICNLTLPFPINEFLYIPYTRMEQRNVDHFWFLVSFFSQRNRLTKIVSGILNRWNWWKIVILFFSSSPAAAHEIGFFACSRMRSIFWWKIMWQWIGYMNTSFLRTPYNFVSCKYKPVITRVTR